MPSPFPGMDPYLEDPDVWPDVHARLITVIGELLAPRVRPKYVARVEQRTFLFGPDDPASELYVVPDARIVKATIPDAPVTSVGGGIAVEIEIAPSIDVTGHLEQWAHEKYIEIRDAANREVVTIIEVVSPSNKVNGSEGRKSFLKKRDEVHKSSTNWLEIDLLRGGTPTVNFAIRPWLPYRAYVDRTGTEEREQRLWQIDLRNRLPGIGVPLRPGEPDVPLDLQAALTLAYDRAEYGLDTDYRKPPKPPLSAEDTTWANQILRERGAIA